MARYFLTLSYNGSPFNGWQIQDNTPHTVQQVLEEKLAMLLNEKIALVGCGRTDTKVNAKQYVAHFDSNHKQLSEQKQRWLYKLNKVLPPEIAVQQLQEVRAEAHARFSANSRTYYYFLSQEKNPFRDAFTHYVYGELDFELMNEAAALLLQYKDFTSFSKLHTQNKTNNCNITKAVWHYCGNQEWRFRISADRFLRGMVRAIVGTLVMVGKKKLSVQEFKTIIEKKDRKLAGNNAPANALFLCGITYPKHLFIE